MDEVVVSGGADGSFSVEVATAGGLICYIVAVPPGYAARLGCPEVADDELVRASFAFLLAREPATSILRRFSLEEIGRYFPDYPEAMARRFNSAR